MLIMEVYHKLVVYNIDGGGDVHHKVQNALSYCTRERRRYTDNLKRMYLEIRSHEIRQSKE
jgi:hypothetical protein